MKKLWTMAAMAFLASACVKHINPEEPVDNWNGYQKYLKMGEQVHTLWAGKNINVGTVTYGIDNSANFYVTYDCSTSGWKISETHMFAGDKKNMPLNKPGAPKIGQFPNSTNHNPNVSIYTYRVPLASLPPCETPGFVVASHCVVHNLAGKTETAWAEGGFTFSDKGWGWYDIYYYNQPANPFTILYGTTHSNDTLKLYHLDITNNSVELTFTEYVGNSPGVYDGAAYDMDSGMLFFVKVNTGQLWVNLMEDEDPSFLAGPLTGDVYSAAFHDGSLYYVDAVANTIHNVSFNENWAIISDLVLDTIPNSVTVNDIALDPAGDYLYILGGLNEGGMQLISWELETETFYSMSVTINNGAQIAYGSDGVLYAIAPITSDGENNFVYSIDTECGTLTAIEDEIINIDDPFSDLSGGPSM